MPTSTPPNKLVRILAVLCVVALAACVLWAMLSKASDARSTRTIGTAESNRYAHTTRFASDINFSTSLVSTTNLAASLTGFTRGIDPKREALFASWSAVASATGDTTAINNTRMLKHTLLAAERQRQNQNQLQSAHTMHARNATQTLSRDFAPEFEGLEGTEGTLDLEGLEGIEGMQPYQAETSKARSVGDCTGNAYNNPWNVTPNASVLEIAHMIKQRANAPNYLSNQYCFNGLGVRDGFGSSPGYSQDQANFNCGSLVNTKDGYTDDGSYPGSQNGTLLYFDIYGRYNLCPLLSMDETGTPQTMDMTHPHLSILDNKRTCWTYVDPNIYNGTNNSYAFVDTGNSDVSGCGAIGTSHIKSLNCTVNHWQPYNMAPCCAGVVDTYYANKRYLADQNQIALTCDPTWYPGSDVCNEAFLTNCTGPNAASLTEHIFLDPIPCSTANFPCRDYMSVFRGWQQLGSADAAPAILNSITSEIVRFCGAEGKTSPSCAGLRADLNIP